MPTTLEELIAAFELFAVCTECHRTELLDLHAMAQRLGASCTIDYVRQHVRCAQCRRRTGDIRIVYVGRSGGARGFHYRL